MALHFFEIGMENDLFQSYGHWWIFRICWHIECSTLTALYFRILNSSAGIPLPPLSLFVVMLPKAHLTLHSRMSGFRWVTTPSWLCRSLRPFLCNSSIYSCYFFLISSASVRSLLFLFFIMSVLALNAPLISCFLDEVSHLPNSFVFLYFLLHSSFHKTSYLSLLFSGTLHSIGYIFPFLPCLLLFFFPQLFVKPPQATTLPSWVFLWNGFGHCLLLRTSIHSSSGILSFRSNLLNLFITSTV